MTIVSGMATGIDTYAHQSCLDVTGQTIAVLGTGVDVIYPKSNKQLYQRILETGLILSEYADGAQPERGNFPKRNRIIAGLSHATLVTEAPERSGALITAYLANDYGRHVYALPDGLDNPTCRGCLVLINTGAAIVMGEDQLVTELLNTNILNPKGNPDKVAQTMAKKSSNDTADSKASQPSSAKPTSKIALDTQPVNELDEALQAILKTIPDTPINLDNLIKATQLDTSALLGGLLQLEPAGAAGLAVRILTFSGICRDTPGSGKLNIKWNKSQLKRWFGTPDLILVTHKKYKPPYTPAWPKHPPACFHIYEDYAQVQYPTDVSRTLSLLDPPYAGDICDPPPTRRSGRYITPAYYGHRPHAQFTYDMAIFSARAALAAGCHTVIACNYDSDRLHKDYLALASEFGYSCDRTILGELKTLNNNAKTAQQETPYQDMYWVFARR